MTRLRIFLSHLARRAAATAFLAALALTPLAGAAAADDAADTRAVIEQQLDAMSRDDWPGAYAYAAPSIQQIFPTPDRFADMVRRGYPMVWRPSSVEFLDSGYVDQSAFAGLYLQRLRLIDENGDPFIARYFLRQVDGRWRISGVEIEREPQSSV